MSGGTRVVAIYADELSRRGHEVFVVAPPTRPVPGFQRVRDYFAGKGWTRYCSRGPSHFDGRSTNVTLLDRWRPVEEQDVPDADIVIATWWETAEWIRFFSARKGAKVYFVQHHEVFPYLPVERCRATYQFPLHKIVVARWLKDLMEREYGDANVDLVPNSVDRSQFFAQRRPKQRRPTVGLLYAASEFKGLDIALAALELVRTNIPELRIMSFGSRDASAHLALPAGTEYLRSPPQDQIREIYASCDVWLTASRSEGFNLPAMEAMACRTPVVSTRAGWPEEAIRPGWNGWLADVDDVAELARGVEWILLRTEDEWRRLSDNALATVETSSWEASTDLFEDALGRAWRESRTGFPKALAGP
ncbi:MULTISPECIES: glycosyltransferase family 4 protein [unclassified Bradyrhizobium]|uniref:glycosyltransferase family 4 protein n=1 Tax=unclassified Bradyrhizobium TaxID=2631580 RepID=UPI002FF0021F